MYSGIRTAKLGLRRSIPRIAPDRHIKFKAFAPNSVDEIRGCDRSLSSISCLDLKLSHLEGDEHSNKSGCKKENYEKEASEGPVIVRRFADNKASPQKKND